MRKSKFSRFNFISALLLITIAAFVFIGCPTSSNPKPVVPPPPPPPPDAAELTLVKLEPDSAAIDELDDIVPGTVITAEQWEAGSLENDQTQQISISGLSSNSKFYVTLTITEGAKAKVVKGTGPSLPNADAFASADDYEAEQELILSNNNYFYVQVTSQNGETVNYYRFWVLAAGANASVSSVTIGGVEAKNGTPGIGSWADVVAGTVELNSTNANNAAIVVNVPSTSGATAVWAVQLKASASTPPDTFNNPARVSFNDGDTLFIKVTASDGTTVFYYKIAARIGWDATVKNIKLGASSTAAADATLGTPVTVEKDASGNFPSVDYEALVPGTFEPGIQQPGTGPGIYITLTDTTAKAYIAVTNADATIPADTDYAELTNTNRTQKFGDPGYLWVKAVSANGNVASYFKIQVIYAKALNVFYGQPEIKDSSEKFIDSIWNAEDLEVFDVSRVNTNEQAPGFKFSHTVVAGKNHTAAKVKALWDDEGLYFYADVDFTDYYENQAAMNANNSTARVMTAGIATSGSEHNCDSVEVFTNERYQTYPTGNHGMQYRVSRDTDGTAIISGMSNDRPNTVPDPIAFFRDSGMYSTWLKTDSNNKQTGYIVIGRVPWAMIGNTNATEVFGENGLVKASTSDNMEGPAIGMELQINASSVAGSRDALLTWNGITTAAWNNNASYGVINLVFGKGRVRGPVKASKPIISTQPVSNTYVLSDVSGDGKSVPPLTVVSPATTGQTRSYKWYQTTADTPDPANTDTDTLLTTGTTGTASFSPKITAKGTYKYYVVVTNTRNDAAEGFKEASNISAIATITVAIVPVPVIKLQPKNTTYAANAVTAAWPIKIEVTGVPGDGITQTIQWYSHTAATGEGTIITGATGASYIPPITTAGVTYYYAIVTNNNTDETETVTSNRAKIEVKEAGTAVDFVIVPESDRTETAVTEDYNRLLLVSLGNDFDITKYARYIFEYRLFNGTTWEDAVASANNMDIQVKWRQDPTTICVYVTTGDTGSLTPNAWGWDTNLTQSNSGASRSLPGYLLKTTISNTDAVTASGVGTGTYHVAPLKYIDFERRATAGANFIIVDKITFVLK